MDAHVFDRGNCQDLEHLEWKNGERRSLFSCPIFKVNEIVRSSTDGRSGKFVEVDSPEWVVILPWFRDDDGVARFIIEQQFRHGAEKVTREFPAGLVEKGEEALVAGRRELMEETGAHAGRMTLLGFVNPNSAFMNNHQSFFLAEDLSLVSGQNLDANEQIDVLSVPVRDVIAQMGEGLYDNGIMMMALGFFLREAHKRPELM